MNPGVCARLIRGLLLLACCHVGGVHAQSSIIDPSILSQLSPEERQQLMRGLGSGAGSTTPQDQYLQQPPVVSQRPSALAADPAAYGDEDQSYYPPSYSYGDSGSGGFDAPPNAREADYYYREGLGADPQMVPEGALGGFLANGVQAGNTGGTRSLQQQQQQELLRSRQSTNPLSNDTRDGVNAASRAEASSAQRRDPRRPRLFGYELFDGVPNTFAPATDIPVPSDYVIGPGDNIRVQLFGNQNETFTLLVSRDGSVNFPKLGPIVATGLRFDELQSMLENRVSKEMIGTTASVTLGRLRSIRVFVLGDVNRPGSYTVSSLSTMTHALFVSGGVSPVGSLRRVQLKRGGDVVATLDLYRFLLGGDSSNDVRLQPGDVVFVPPVAGRVTVEGEVKRPAVYEIAGERSLADVIALAGGRFASTDQTYVQVERVSADAGRNVLNLDMSKPEDMAASIRDGDIVRVRKVAKQLVNEIRVSGYVQHPGVYPWNEQQDLRSVLQLAGVLESNAESEVYLPLGVIERTNAQTGIREFHSFNVAKMLATDSAPVPLQSNDLVIVFGRDDIAFLSSYDVEAVLSGKVSSLRGCPAILELRSIANSQRAVRFLKTLASESVRLEDSARQRSRCPEIFRETPRALPYLLEKGVGIYGEVGRPGLYPVSDDTNIGLLLQAAGGATAESDAKNVEYVSYQDALSQGRSRYQVLDLSSPDTIAHAVAAGDILNFRPVYLDQEVGSVRVMGEVRFPGTYGIVRGETLAQVIKRAGGLTQNAYPYGSVFTRESAREAEKISYKRAATDLQEAVVTVVTSGALGGDSASAAQFMEGAIRRLNTIEPMGRVVIQADPAILQVRPELDVTLEPGDALFVPKRPSSVAVAGQVLSAGSLAFSPGASANYYIDRAGGFGQAADKKRAFVVLPDGSARALKLSSWNFEKQDIPPGSSIVVPRNAAPINKLLLTERIFGIFSDLALSAAALVTISDR